MQFPWELVEVVAVLERKQRLPQESQTMESAFVRSAWDQTDRN